MGRSKQLLYNKRRHIVHSLDSVLSVLHVLSHLHAPSIWFLIARYIAQTHLTNPMAGDRQRSLRFWFLLAVLVNTLPILFHSFTSLDKSGAMLDFVGAATPVARWQVVSLDYTIIFLQWIKVYIAYEAFLARWGNESSDDPISRPISPSELESAVKAPSHDLVLDLSLGHLLDRLLHPPKIPTVPTQGPGLADAATSTSTARAAASFTFDLPFEPEFDVFPRAQRTLRLPHRPPRPEPPEGRVPGSIDS